MKRSSSIFKLKKNYKNLENDDYAHNLKMYFGCLNSVKTITLEDFSYILTGLNAANSTVNTAAPSVSNSDNSIPVEVLPSGAYNLHQGFHVAGVWSDDSDPRSYWPDTN